MFPFALIVSIFPLWAHCAAPQLLKLNSFPGATKTKINVPGPFSLYAPSSYGSGDLLSQVYVVEEDESRRVSISDLQKRRLNRDSGFLHPYRTISRDVWIVSELSDSEMSQLEGYLYVTTEGQMNDNYFYVYDVDQKETITRMWQNCTLVFLNWHESTLITDFGQWNTTTVSIYHGIPKDDEELPNSQIFSNPVSTTDGMRLMPKVEPIYLTGLPAFYIKIKGLVMFTISSDHYKVDGTTTTAPTTTGLLMKPIGDQDLNVTVKMMSVPDAKNQSMMTGCNAVGTMPKDASISFTERSTGNLANGYTVTPVEQMLGWSTPVVGDSVNANSKGAKNGQFFVQYYIIRD